MDFPSTFETERLHLRRLLPEDRQDVFLYASDPEVTLYMTFPTANKPEDSDVFLVGSQELMNQGTEFHWAIEIKGSSGMVGVISFRRSTHGLEFGWILNRDYWNKGYMTEAARELLRWGFEEEGAWRVWATCNVNNPASAQVMQKIGMTEEGVLKRWVAAPNISDKAEDCRVFSIVR